MRMIAMITLFAFAFAFLWFGSHTAPQTGWPQNDVELNGCAALVLGIIAKFAGQWILLGFGRQRTA